MLVRMVLGLDVAPPRTVPGALPGARVVKMPRSGEGCTIAELLLRRCAQQAAIPTVEGTQR